MRKRVDSSKTMPEGAPARQGSVPFGPTSTNGTGDFARLGGHPRYALHCASPGSRSLSWLPATA